MVCPHRCIPQSEASNNLMRGILRGTASDYVGGVDALGAVAGLWRESYCFNVFGSSARAARIADRLGEPRLATQYAKQFLARGGHRISRTQMHALLGRHAAQDGGRDAAVTQWRKAATVAMDGRYHLLALRVGWECGGTEGREIAAAACAAMGRAESVVREELEAAGAVIPRPQQPTAQNAVAAGAGGGGGLAGAESPPSGTSAELSLEDWLVEIKLAQFLRPIIAQGCGDLGFLRDIDDNDVSKCNEKFLTATYSNLH